ncbi:MAG: hypothetical protein WD069_22195 [Planctomycetales bacterium]
MEDMLRTPPPREPAPSLADRIERLVRRRTSGMVRDLRVEVFGDQVVLSGRTATYHVKQLATHGAQDAVRDLQLVNDIEVG